MALQGDKVCDENIRLRESHVVVDDKHQLLRDLGRQVGPASRRESQHRRHTRVVSEGCDRLLDIQHQTSKEEAYGRPASRGKYWSVVKEPAEIPNLNIDFQKQCTCPPGPSSALVKLTSL